MSIPGAANPLLLASAAEGGYQISRSLRFNSSDSAYLSRTPASAGNRKTWTWAGWVKRSGLGSNQLIFGSSTLWFELIFNSSNQLQIYWESSGTGSNFLISNAVYRDISAWMHIAWQVDTTQATSTSRIKVYVNGAEISWSSASYPAQNYDTGVNATTAHGIGSRVAESNLYLSAYLADVHLIDGQALTPSSFTKVDATTGQLIPKKYTGSFGTNGFWLKFSDNSAATATTLGKDYSGNSNNWTPNNLSVTAGAGNDSLVDTPTSYGTDTGAGGEVRGNYATLNPLDKGSGPTLANGNLDVTGTAGVVRGTMFMPSGKWYFEGTLTALGNSGNNTPRFGVANAAEPIATSDAGSSNNVATIICSPNGTFGGRGIRGGTTVGTGNPFAAGDVAMVAYDADTGNIWFGKNGTWINSGNPATGASPTFTGLTAPYAPLAQTDPAGFYCNFGQRQWAYQAPAGFKALCDTNLPAPVVAKPSEVMDVKLYTGNGSTQTISGLGFSPDLVWVKGRARTWYHNLFDTIRGATKSLSSNDTGAERTLSNDLTAFNSDGFSLSSGLDTNENGYAYAAWAWDAGSSTVTNTQGSITSQVRANPSAGFSVVTMTTAGTGTYTWGHGLGVAPAMVIVKDRDNAGTSWFVYHSAVVTNTSQYLNLNTTGALATAAGIWGSALPTSTVVSMTANTGVFANAKAVAYCFAPVAGYSSFGSYVGNGSADGPFVYTGFRPRWVMIKRSDSASVSYGWFILDTARNTYNVMNTWLAADSSAADGADVICDTLANGFKIRTTAGNINTNAGTFVYACFAESPFQYARAR